MCRCLIHPRCPSAYELSLIHIYIPLTVFGIVNKVNGLMMSLIMGISVGSQPLFSYNYGAKLFTRVKKLAQTCLIVCVTIGFLGMLCLQIFPQQIISIFGQENDLYNDCLLYTSRCV